MKFSNGLPAPKRSADGVVNENIGELRHAVKRGALNLLDFNELPVTEPCEPKYAVRSKREEAGVSSSN
jgi:hypothetical protein